MRKHIFLNKLILPVIALTVASLIIGCAPFKQQVTSKPSTVSPPISSKATSENVVERRLQLATEGGREEVIHNAKIVPHPGEYQLDQITLPAGIECDGLSPDLGVHWFYKNRSERLEVIGTKWGLKYISGKGVVIFKGKIYCFGF